MNKNKGFTLIELLVVIAIIGILSSVVLASLNTARAKGADAAIKSNLANIRAQAEIIYDSTGCYTEGSPGATTCNATTPAVVTAGACPASGADNFFGNTNAAAAIASALSATGGSFASCAATVGGTQWAAAVRLKSDLSKAWCVDSAGTSKQVSDAAGTYDLQAELDADTTGGVCGS